jgi:hypothetical protein
MPNIWESIAPSKSESVIEMADRKHRVIKEAIFNGAGVFQFDIETQQFETLLVTWINADDAGAAPTSLIFCPTNTRRTDGNVLNNFPTPAALVMPVAGASTYLGIGPNCMIALPLPQMITVGVVGSAGSKMSIRIEGDEVSNLLESPVTLERARS